MPRGKHIGYYAHSLYAEGVCIYLALGEVLALVLQPDEEVILHGERFQRGADGRPEEADPTNDYG